MLKSRNIILVVDRDPHTYRILDLVLDKDDFETIECLSGKQAVRMCASISPDIVLLDLDMPDMPGKQIIRAIREWSQMPIIIVSSHETNDDVVKGLDMGADDYVLKPFNTDVLKARINASLRKSAVHIAGAPEIFNGPLRMDLMRHEVFMGNELIPFTPKEYNLLRYFIMHCGKMLSHKDILNEVWGPAHSKDLQYLRVFIMQIRRKLEKNPSVLKLISTELGIGYRMEFLQDVSSSMQDEFQF